MPGPSSEWDALDAFLSDPDAYDSATEDGERVHDVPEIDDTLLAERTLRRIARLQRQIAASEDAATSQIDMTRRWLDDRTSGAKRYVALLEGALESWWRSSRPPDTKSVTLPSGTVRLRASGKPAVVDVDESGLEALALTDPRYVRSRLALAKSVVSESLVAGPVCDDQADAPEGKTIHHAVDADGVQHQILRFVVSTEDRFTVEAN